MQQLLNKSVVNLLVLSLAIVLIPISVLAQECGDADGSGDVTATDALKVLRVAVQQDSGENCVLPRNCWEAGDGGICDVNDDDQTTATDALGVLRNAVGIEDSVLVCCTVDPCEDVNCPGGQACYMGACHYICSAVQDCANDEEACWVDYCATDPCEDVQCPPEQACFMGGGVTTRA
jgi:hypothetical protein